MKKYIVVTLIFLVMAQIALAADISIKGAVEEGSLQSGIRDAPLYLDTRSNPTISSFHWFNTMVNWFKVFTGKLSFMNGIPFTSLTPAEKSFYLANGALNFNPVEDPRYVNLEQDAAAVKAGTYVAVIAEADHTWYNPTTQSYEQSRDPTISSAVPANAEVIPIVYKDKLTGETKTAYTIAGRTEMDFTTLNSWTMKEYVPNGEQYSYYYDRNGGAAPKTETFTPSASAPTIKTDVGVPQPLPEEVPEAVPSGEAVNPIDNTLFFVLMGSFLITIVAGVVIISKKRK